MFKVSIFPKELEKEVVEDVGILTSSFVKKKKKFYRKVEIIDDNVLTLNYISIDDGELLFKNIKANSLENLKKQFDIVYTKLKLNVSEKEWKNYQDLEFDNFYSDSIY